jgi:hypothetical protein
MDKTVTEPSGSQSKLLFNVENLPDLIVGVCWTPLQTFDYASHLTRSGKASNLGLGEH